MPKRREIFEGDPKLLVVRLIAIDSTICLKESIRPIDDVGGNDISRGKKQVDARLRMPNRHGIWIVDTTYDVLKYFGQTKQISICSIQTLLSIPYLT